VESWVVFAREVEDLAGIYHEPDVGKEGPNQTFFMLSDRVTTALWSFKNDCGYDFNNLILQYPFDGQLHEVKCPQCGEPRQFRSPMIDVEPD